MPLKSLLIHVCVILQEKSPFVLGFAVLGFPISEVESSEQDQLSPASANIDTDGTLSVKAATTSSDTVNCASTSTSLGKYCPAHLSLCQMLIFYVTQESLEISSQVMVWQA